MLFLCMTVLMLASGFFIGAALDSETGGLAGILFALGLWTILSAVAYFAGDALLLSANHAKPVTPDMHPQLFNIVEEMKIAANLPSMPKVYIIDDTAVNAFATGIHRDKTAVAVTAGMLAKMNRDELQGVVAHEMSHILNRDVLYMTFAGVLLGSIQLMSEFFLRGFRYSGGSSRSRARVSAKGGGGQLQLIFIVFALLFAILGPILCRLFYFSISRKREFLADASGARLTRYPEGLASALEKISGSRSRPFYSNDITAAMCIAQPLENPDEKLTDIFSTHPPITERIHILRAMSQGVQYAEYQKAFQKVTGKKSALIPMSGLSDSAAIASRPPSVEPEIKIDPQHEALDIMRALNGYLFLECTCGLRIKAPAGLGKKEILCPKCTKSVAIPHAMETPAAPGPAFSRHHKGWESFLCACGKPLQLSPAFRAPHIQCPHCGKKVAIVTPSTDKG